MTLPLSNGSQAVNSWILKSAMTAAGVTSAPEVSFWNSEAGAQY